MDYQISGQVIYWGIFLVLVPCVIIGMLINKKIGDRKYEDAKRARAEEREAERNANA